MSSRFEKAKGFLWPKKGRVACADWEPTYKYGHGLHGLLWGEGDGKLLSWNDSAVWLVVQVRTKYILTGKDELTDKCKFASGLVVFAGTRDKAIEILSQNKSDYKGV
jgi:hypothetical protein